MIGPIVNLLALSIAASRNGACAWCPRSRIRRDEPLC